MMSNKCLGVMLFLFTVALPKLPAQPVFSPELAFHCFDKKGKGLHFGVYGKAPEEVQVKTKRGRYKMLVTLREQPNSELKVNAGIVSNPEEVENRLKLSERYPHVRLEIKHCKKMMTVDLLHLNDTGRGYYLDTLRFQPGQFTIDAREFPKPQKEEEQILLHLDDAHQSND